MLHSNKTYDNSNLRDVQKVFNAGIVKVYKARGRELQECLGTLRYSLESVSFETQTIANQDGNKTVEAIGVPALPGAPVIEKGYVLSIEGQHYVVKHAQYKDTHKPCWYKVYMERGTVPYAEV